MLLKGKVVLVTGGARGLGRADALALAEAGADVVIADILDAEKTVSDVRSIGRKSLAIKMDVTNMGEVKEGVEKIKKGFWLHRCPRKQCSDFGSSRPII